MKIKAKTPTKKIVTVTSKAKITPASKKVLKPKAPKTHRVTFTVHAEIGSQVFVAGSFNNWNPTDKAMTDKKGMGLYTVTVTLPPGKHEYKFVIDGTWCADPECADWVQNEHGTLNSVIRVS